MSNVKSTWDDWSGPIIEAKEKTRLLEEALRMRQFEQAKKLLNDIYILYGMIGYRINEHHNSR